MSQENLELVARAGRAFAASPKPDYETLNELVHPDHVLVPAGVATGLEKVAHGESGFREWHRSVQSLIPATFEFQGAVDLGDDKVLTVTRASFEGTASGAGGEARIWSVVTVRDGKLSRTESYTDPADALRAAMAE